MLMGKSLCLTLAGVCLLVMVAFTAQSAMLDLTVPGASGFINDGLFVQSCPGDNCSMLVNPFVRIGGQTSVLHAYNTTVDEVLDNGNIDLYNHELLLSDVPIVNIGGRDYRQFMLDINQRSEISPLLSLDEVQIFLSGTPNQGVETFTDGILDLADASLVYRMDDLRNDNWVALDYSINGTNCPGDMLAYIPSSFFDGSGPYVYLYSRFGENLPENDGTGFGREQWAVLCPVPEPSTMLLVGGGLLGLLGLRRKRMLG